MAPSPPFPAQKHYSPYAGRNFPTQVLWGDTHLHTANSPDAFAFGTRNTPDDAYRFCKGEPVKLATTGETVQKKTPYDWCAVTDHAEYMGIMPLLLKKGNPLANTEIGKMIASGSGRPQGERAIRLWDVDVESCDLSSVIEDQSRRLVIERQAWKRPLCAGGLGGLDGTSTTRSGPGVARLRRADGGGLSPLPERPEGGWGG